MMSSLDGETATRGDDTPLRSTKWPAWFYGPSDVEGEDFKGEIFKSSDEVPSGWEDHPSKIIANKKSGKANGKQVDPYKDWTREQVIGKLKEKNVSYDESWSDDKLKAVLRASDDAK